MITVSAPAKLNLTLEVLGKRGDGYHEIRSVIQTISLCDQLSFVPGDTIDFRCDLPGWMPEQSLVSKAAALIREATGCSKGASVTIEKRIPLLSGLGGDSSDAAATLRGLDMLWGLRTPLKQLHALAERLGSDVPFFLYGGTVLMEGRGEIVTPLLPLPRTWVVVALPPVPGVPGKTRQLYESLKPEHYTDGEITRRMVENIKAGREVNPSLLFNVFENVAFTVFSGLKTFRDRLAETTSADVHLAGSGPALFVMAKNKAHAEEVCAILKTENMEAYPAETVACVEGDI